MIIETGYGAHGLSQVGNTQPLEKLNPPRAAKPFTPPA